MLCIANNKSYDTLITNVIYKVVEMSIDALSKAIDVCGGQSSLASKIGKKQAHISMWLSRDMKVPADQVLKIEQVTGVPRHELRPDLYPPEEYKAISEMLQQQKAA